MAGHDLTVLSRREGGAPTGVKQICAERETGLAMLKGCSFDLVMDFICFDKQGLKQLAANIFTEHYVLISTTWLPRLWSGSRADELSGGLTTAASHLPKITQKYLNGKLCAERGLATLRQNGCKAVSLRLPIMLGDGDHTGRSNFYRCRLTDGRPLIAVDGGQNLAQIGLMEDLAQAIVRWVNEADIVQFPIWEALPGNGRSVRSIIETMASALGVRAKLVDVPATVLARNLPSYLETEPFWRESAMPVTSANIYATLGIIPAVFGQFLNRLPSVDNSPSSLRSEELRFLANRHYI